METRNILNHLDQVIGQLSLPDNTPEEIWQSRLAPYKAPPVSITIADIVSTKILDYEKMAPALLREVKTANTISGITVDESREVFKNYRDVLTMIREGAFPTALAELQAIGPIGFINQARFDSLAELIKKYI